MKMVLLVWTLCCSEFPLFGSLSPDGLGRFGHTLTKSRRPTLPIRVERDTVTIRPKNVQWV